MEQSVDIDQHLKNFKKDMLTNQLENQKYELEEALRKKMKEARSKMNKDLAEQKAMIQKDIQKKLDDEKAKL